MTKMISVLYHLTIAFLSALENSEFAGVWLRLHKVFSLDFIQITYFVSISFQITYSLKCVNELQHEILSELIKIIRSTLEITL